jgi:hypothetical protein
VNKCCRDDVEIVFAGVNRKCERTVQQCLGLFFLCSQNSSVGSVAAESVYDKKARQKRKMTFVDM